MVHRRLGLANRSSASANLPPSYPAWEAPHNVLRATAFTSFPLSSEHESGNLGVLGWSDTLARTRR